MYYTTTRLCRLILNSIVGLTRGQDETLPKGIYLGTLIAVSALSSSPLTAENRSANLSVGCSTEPNSAATPHHKTPKYPKLAVSNVARSHLVKHMKNVPKFVRKTARSVKKIAILGSRIKQIFLSPIPEAILFAIQRAI
jgi:hypothetical protein